MKSEINLIGYEDQHKIVNNRIFTPSKFIYFYVLQTSSQSFPFSPRSASFPDLSKESFVSGGKFFFILDWTPQYHEVPLLILFFEELALNRLDQDQDSWRKNYGCFASMEGLADDQVSTTSSRPVNVTQNLDMSLSGVISGDVTVR